MMPKTIFFTIVFAIVESENKHSWSWFLVQLQDRIVSMKSDLIIFDRQKGLLDAMSTVFPNAHHSNYLHHLAQNLYGETKDNLARGTYG